MPVARRLDPLPHAAESFCFGVQFGARLRPRRLVTLSCIGGVLRRLKLSHCRVKPFNKMDLIAFTHKKAKFSVLGQYENQNAVEGFAKAKRRAVPGAKIGKELLLG